jgi:capsid protein
MRIADRPGQSHGVPIFHAVLQDLRDLDLLMLASLKRIQIAACLAVFLESEEQLENIVQKTAKKYGFVLDQKLQPGMIMKTYPGEKVTTLVPNMQVPELQTFVVMLAQRIGAALGVSWQVILKDFSKSNYSSARTDLLETRQIYIIFQNWYAGKQLAWEWVEIIKDGLLMGDRDLIAAGVTLEDLTGDKVTWIVPGWKWVDPAKEAKGVEIRYALKMTTLRDEIAALGKDWEEVQDQILREEKRWNERRDAEGLPPAPLREQKQAPAGPGGVSKQVEDLIEEKAEEERQFAASMNAWNGRGRA